MAELNAAAQSPKDKKELRDRLASEVAKPIWTYAVVAKDYEDGKPISSMRFDVPFELQDRPMRDILGILFDPKEGNVAILVKKEDDDFKKPVE